MITIICGLIGSGKSTYAAAHFETVIECEDGYKDFQLERAKMQRDNFAYVTCYPTVAELLYFGSRKDVRWVWINTTEEQAKKNIYKRKRKRDFANIENVLIKNRKLAVKGAHTNIHFEYIDLFDAGEKW